MRLVQRLLQFIRLGFVPRPADKPWSPMYINVHLAVWRWQQTLKRISAEPDLNIQQKMVRQLSAEMNAAYWRWRLGKRYFPD